MKKIGIITFHRAYNYGASLQCYALQTIIANYFKSDVEIIDYIDENVMSGYRFFPKKNLNLKKIVKGIIKYILFSRKTKKRYYNFDKYIHEKYIMSNTCFKDINQLINYKHDYDTLITGSDQVWSIKIVGELSDAFTLNFGDESINRISYAASVGDSTQITKNQDIYYKKISKINHISVRENDAKDKLEKIINKNISVVLDPTLLLKKENWDKEIINLNKSSEKYILAYVVEPDNQYVKIVNELSRKTGLKVIHFGNRNPGYKNVLKTAYTEGPLEFVNYIKNAEYVVATSFHATVFSIIYNKKFFIIPHKKTGARVTNILNKLGISGRTFYSLDEFNKM